MVPRIMNLHDNDELPHGPNLEIKSKYRNAFLSKPFGWAMIAIIILTAGCTMVAIIKSGEISARLDQQSRDITELKNVIHLLTEQHPRELKNGIARLAETQSQKMRDIESRLSEKRLLIHVPFIILTGAEEAHVLMTAGGILHDEYAKFIRSRQDNAVANNIAAFTRCNANSLIFNLWYLHQTMNIRFDRVYSYQVMESVKTTASCVYKLLQGPGDNMTAFGEYTSIYNLDTYFTPPHQVNCESPRISIMEICV